MLDKVPGSNNPPSPLADQGFEAMTPVCTTHPKMDYAMGNPGQATSPVESKVNPSSNTAPLPIGQGVQGVMNTGKNANA